MRRSIIVILGATAAAVAISSAFLFGEIDRRWQELDERVDAMQARLETADFTRPVLYGTSIRGDAWTSYESALSLARADKSLEKSVRPLEYAALEPEVRKRILAAHAGTLDELRQGAHCADVRKDIDWSRGFFSAEAQSLLMTRALANLAVAQSQARIESGRSVEAVETLLDAAQLGRDLMHSHLLSDEMIGSAILGISTFWVAESSQLLDRLPPEALERFAQGLAVLDRSIANMGPSHHSEALLFARSLLFGRSSQGEPTCTGGTSWSTDAWRYGFSTGLMTATMGLQRLELADRIATAADDGWPTFETYFSRHGDEDPANANLRSGLLTRFRTIAQLRLLRMAIDHKLGRTITALPDPFGSTLQHTIDDEGKTRFWSAGPEGNQDLFLFSRSGE